MKKKEEDESISRFRKKGVFPRMSLEGGGGHPATNIDGVDIKVGNNR
jgi:hypothetical protein